jgi:hypothetical protein
VKITEFCFIKAQYESKVTWKVVTDYLRCSPKFYNQPRYDCVIINTADGYIFAQLALVFTIKINDRDYPIALIRAFERPVSVPRQIQQKDKDLHFLRLQQVKESQMEFVWAQSIVRGAVIVLANDLENHWIVFDVLDADMYLRVRDILDSLAE